MSGPEPARGTGRRGEGAGPPVVAVVGPTATGKSDLAVELALRLGGQVVNADSMQLYRGMDVGTAKLPDAARRGVRHHLLDVWDVRRAANVADYQGRARAAVDALRADGVVPVLVGGSGLYVRAVLDALEFPGTDPAARARLEADLAADGPAALHARLAAADPAAAAAIGPGNGRRLVRALEVVGLRGAFRATLPAPAPVYPCVQVGLRLARPALDARIAARVRRMLADGLVAEVEGLVAAGLREGRTASAALGYRQVLAHLDGACTLDDAAAATVAATRAFARRQLAWFRRDPHVTWLEADDPGLGGRALALVAAARG